MLTMMSEICLVVHSRSSSPKQRSKKWMHARTGTPLGFQPQHHPVKTKLWTANADTIKAARWYIIVHYGHKIQADTFKIACDYCNTWQHCHCYGYLGLRDPRIPDKHACYLCLLGKKEGGLLKELRDLVLLRNAVHVLKRDGGLKNINSLKSDLRKLTIDSGYKADLFVDVDSESAKAVIKTLKTKKYLSEALVSSQRGLSHRTKPNMELVSQGPMYKAMMNEYFDPSSKIAHHVGCSQTLAKRIANNGQLVMALSDVIITDSIFRTAKKWANTTTTPRQQKKSQVLVVASQEGTNSATDGSHSTIMAEQDRSAPNLRPSQPNTTAHIQSVNDKDDLYVGAAPTKQSRKRPRTDPPNRPKTPGSRKRPKMSRASGFVDVSYYTPN